MIENVPVLMTASVSTHGMKGALFSDEEREQMYLTTLEYYLENMPGVKFVFAENSGWDLTNFKQKLPPPSVQDVDSVEFISVSPNLCDNTKGKGYNEMILLSTAISKSEFIKNAKCFLKVTGRYPIYNLQYFVNQATMVLNRGYALYCDVKDHSLYELLRLGWNGHSFETRLFACKVDFFKNEFEPSTSICNDYEGRLLESVLFDVYKKSDSKIVDRFKKEPFFGGLAGHQINAVSFSQENDSFKSKIKRFVGNSIRLLMPWFKF